MEGLHAVGGHVLKDKYQISIDCMLCNCTCFTIDE
jgi:hypothetical protein